MAIKDWPGGVVTDIPVEPSGNYEDSAASGVWTLDQVADYVKQDLWPTPGNIDPAKYVEGVFSTYLYTGNGSSQTITNGIDLDGEGGLVWMKGRSGATDNALYDTIRGATKELLINSFAAQTTQATGLTSFSSTGFSIGALAKLNTNAATYVSWTFRKAENFFNVLTWTGDDSTTRNIPHGLGSTPGMIIVRTYDTANFYWVVWHKSLGQYYYLKLDQLDPQAYNSSMFKSVDATNIQVGLDGNVNSLNKNYVAYVFGDDAGGFGDDGSESIIKCGSYTGTGGASATFVNLGFEPQFVFIMNSTYGTYNLIYDSMRGIVTGGNDAMLNANTSSAENGVFASLDVLEVNATGFTIKASGADVSDRAGSTYVYMAIRRPMMTPTAGTEVFAPIAWTGDNTNNRVLPTGFDVDAVWNKYDLPSANCRGISYNRLTSSEYLQFDSTAAAGTNTLGILYFDLNNGIDLGDQGGFDKNRTGYNHVGYNFKRAPGFFDVVAYTGTGSATSFNHNLGVIPQLQIIKRRDSTGSWYVNAYDLSPTLRGFLNLGNNFTTNGTEWSGSDATTFSVYSGGLANINISGADYINYLFASVAGVSKVGSYTGTGSNVNVDCGFSAGARFILIKRTDSSGDWYVYDSERGIVAGDDPYVLLNSVAAEVTNTDYIDPLSSGFTVTSSAPAALNASGGNYIFLAIA